MIQIPFLIGAAIGAGATLYVKRKNREKNLFNTIKDSVKSGATVVTGAATTTVDTVKSTVETTADSVKSTVETVKEKNAEKKAARVSKADAK